MEHIPKNGDYFRWDYTDEYVMSHSNECHAGTLYWCMARICVFQDGKYEDIYWGNSSNNKIVNPENVSLEFLGNINDYQEVRSKDDFKFYDSGDILDISHPNSMGDGCYVKKGAKRSKYKIKESLLEEQRKLEYKLCKTQRDCTRLTNKIKELETLTDEQLEKFWF